jgi:hypothetical protein
VVPVVEGIGSDRGGRVAVRDPAFGPRARDDRRSAPRPPEEVFP